MEPHFTSIPDLSPEFVFQTSRSSGSGGQNVNKVNSRVELRFDVPNSLLLTEEHKQILLEKLAARITADGILQVVCQVERSQLLNKEEAVRKFYALLEKAFRPVKKRKATSPTKASVEKRLASKKQLSEKKSLRGKPDF